MVGSNSEMGGEIVGSKPETRFIVGLILGGVVDGVADDAAVSGESDTRSRRRIMGFII